MSSTIWAYVAFGTVSMLIAAWMGLIQRVQVGQGLVLLRATAVAALVLSLVALSGAPGTLGSVLASIALIVSGLFLGLGSLAGQSKQTPAFAVGSPLPDFEAPDHNGETFRSVSLRGKPMLIKFFRGHW